MDLGPHSKFLGPRENFHNGPYSAVKRRHKYNIVHSRSFGPLQCDNASPDAWMVFVRHSLGHDKKTFRGV